MAQAELFWYFLQDGELLKELKQINLDGFDWSASHESGMTIMVFCVRTMIFTCHPKYDEGLSYITWLIQSGARVEQKCTGGESSHRWPHKPEVPVVKVNCKGFSAISYVWKLRETMRENLSHWRDQVEFLTKALKCFATASNALASGPRVPIHEGIAELWEKSLADKVSHDVTIETADGAVTAHTHMLKAASPVVAAMLGSPMKEGKAQRIEIKDSILYTCSSQEEPGYQTALQALDLAHRWQVEVVVTILSDLLTGMITDASFSAIAEHAVLKGLEHLTLAVKNFGTESKKVQADLKGGCLPAAVLQLFPAPQPKSEPKPKRRRM